MRVLHSLRSQTLLSLFVFSTCFLALFQFAPQLTAARSEPSNVSQDPAAAAALAPSPSPSPAPFPTPPKQKSSDVARVFRTLANFLACNPAKVRKERELSRGGPQFPREYDTSNFSIVALTKGGWAVGVEYQLPAGSSASITFEVKDVATFTQTITAQNIVPPSSSVPDTGSFHAAVFQLPQRPGEKGPQATLISFRALTDASPRIPAEFQVVGLALGDEALESALNIQRPSQISGTDAFAVKASFQSFAPSAGLTGWPQQVAKSVAIKTINVSPDRVEAAKKGAFNYYFLTAKPFGAWRAEYRRDTRRLLPNGRYENGSVYVGQQRFEEPVVLGSNPQPPPRPNSKVWNVDRKTISGKYRISVFTFNEGGESATKVSRVVAID